MAIRDEIREFLLSRRARVSPQSVGLPGSGTRRVAGLRREEVAQLAGVSVEYYIRLERGNCRGISDAVLASVARALRLDDAERAHLFALVQAANSRVPTGARRAWPLRPGVQRLLDAMVDAPAYVWDGRLDVIAANALGRALFAPMLEGSALLGADASGLRPPRRGSRPGAGAARPARTPSAGLSPLANQARFLFLKSSSRAFFPDWDALARDAVAVLRSEAGRNPHDARLADLVRDLTTESALFREMWAEYVVSKRGTGVKRFHHPIVGPLTLTFESMLLATDPDLRISAGTAEPGSASETALRLLASWAATPRTSSRTAEGES